MGEINHLMITIYGLCDPETKECRYVGKTNDIDDRLREHKHEIVNSHLHTHKVNWLRSLDCMPEVKILQEVDDEHWEDAEIYWINKLKFQFANLTNFAKGGQTSPVEGIGHSEETKRKISQHHLQTGIKPPSRKGCIPWNKGLRGVNKANSGTFRKGMIPWNKELHKTYCPNGHEYSQDNTRLYHRKDKNQTYQICKICAAETQRRYSAKRR